MTISSVDPKIAGEKLGVTFGENVKEILVEENAGSTRQIISAELNDGRVERIFPTKAGQTATEAARRYVHG